MAATQQAMTDMSAASLPIEQPKSITEGTPRDPLVELIERIANGEQAALDELRVACLSNLYAVSKRILVTAEDAEETVYDVLLWVWHNPDRFNPSRGTVSAWLNNLAWSRSIDLLRKRKRRQSLMHPDADLATYEGQEKNPDNWLSCFDDQSRIRRALSELKLEQRQMLLMAFFEGLTHQEITERTQRPLGTVKSLIRRGLLQMRPMLSKDE